MYQLVMATHWLLCLCRRNAEQGIYLLLPSLAGSSGKRRGILTEKTLHPRPWTKSPFCRAELSCTAPAAVGSTRWGSGEARQLQHSHPLAYPENSYFQKITFLSCAFHGFSHTIHTTAYLPSTQASRSDTLLKEAFHGV